METTNVQQHLQSRCRLAYRILEGSDLLALLLAGRADNVVGSTRARYFCSVPCQIALKTRDRGDLARTIVRAIKEFRSNGKGKPLNRNWEVSHLVGARFQVVHRPTGLVWTLEISPGAGFIFGWS